MDLLNELLTIHSTELVQLIQHFSKASINFKHLIRDIEFSSLMESDLLFGKIFHNRTHLN
ncbi:hypothetical protein BpHYR1_014152 [Brachionus plicatilis]|uniref:Uncharacterized protein n=1 Tax=Brachionus plicatilis TaxID=10195 RepID=A0A3M7Q996_BRAPC|nr:hypothetical protein BpHYR1_014152 [Brachionus plicatilis]